MSAANYGNNNFIGMLLRTVSAGDLVVKIIQFLKHWTLHEHECPAVCRQRDDLPDGADFRAGYGVDV